MLPTVMINAGKMSRHKNARTVSFRRYWDSFKVIRTSGTVSKTLLISNLL